jgi:uncharacterized protein (DUF488 family)
VLLLRKHGIGLVVDVRSHPYSRHVPQANRQALWSTLESVGIEYRWMGDRLGGMPGGKSSDYDKISERPSFRQGITDLLSLSREQPTAIMCAEGDYRRCHRHHLIAPHLLDQGISVIHIQPDGSLVDASRQPAQLTLL